MAETVSERIKTTEIPPNIGIDASNRDAVIRILAKLLADEYTLYTKTRKYHWNVDGPNFQQLHEFFKAHYEQLDIVIDDVAERIPQLGGKAVATLDEFVSLSRLKEDPGEYPDAHKMLANLLADHEAIIRSTRSDAEDCLEKYRDSGTNDFLVGLVEQHEKMAWMLRAHLEGR